jgi:cell division protein FtsB
VAKAIKLNGRAFAFIGACFLVVLMLAVPLRSLLQERREIAALETQLATQQAAIDDFNNRKARFADPAYVATLARARLNYVFPGEIGFIVLDEETNTAINTLPGALVPNDDSAWYSKLWSSTRLADNPPAQNDPFVVQSEDMPQ